MDLCLFLNHQESEVEGVFEVTEYIGKCVIMELDISEQDPEDMDLTDVVLEYDELVSAISILEKRREELRARILNSFMEKDIDVLRVGNVELRRKKAEWKLWRINMLKSYLMKKELWDMVETVDRKSLSKLIEKGILTEEELKGTYDVETRYSLHVSRV
jgi:hypothetical protein